MKKSSKRVERSREMIVAGYYLARCGKHTSDGRIGPPDALDVVTWSEAYDIFYDAMGDGRTRTQFRNSLNYTRNEFDNLFENGRIGWKDRDGKQRRLGNKSKEVYEEWINRDREELEEYVLDLLNKSVSIPAPQIARTEGGQRVFFSVRRERDGTLRKIALAIHGYNCMACGFNYEDCYGEIGKGFIEVHHVVPLASVGVTKTNPETDLFVLCANCHRMVHRKKGVCLSIQELKECIQR
ncbi:MAG: hypothetical protein F4Y61_09800 [Rhodothermaceae bacterium]|nr:hypothetical protein [Rhodothermaceae bacterium]